MNPFDDQTREIASQAARLLAGRRSPAYLVGGAVRDALMGRKTRDIDIAVEGSAHRLGEAIAGALDGHFVSLDPVRDISRVVVDVDDGRVWIDLSSMDGEGIEADLKGRDFAIDAIAVDLDAALSGRWKSIDPLGGKDDVERRIIRAVSPTVFRDDPLRLLRGLRLAAETGFELDTPTASLIQDHVSLLSTASAERVREELLRTLSCPGAGASIRLMDDLGLLSVVIPELDDARGVEQPREHYYDVLGHLLAAVEHADQIVHRRFNTGFVRELVPTFDGFQDYFAEQVSDGHNRGTLLKLTALLHDVAKPQTRSVEPSGRVRFFGHSEAGAEVVAEVLRRLRFGRRGIRHVRTMVLYHLRPGQMAKKGEVPTRRAISRYYRDLGDVALDTVYLNMADFLAARGPMMTRSKLKEQTIVVDRILEVGPRSRPEAPAPRGLLTGHDIMREFDIQPGPEIGRLLRAVASDEAEGRVATREEALELARAHLDSGASRG